MKQERGAKVTMQDIVKYYDGVLANGDGFDDRTRRYVTELRDAAAAGVLAVPSQDGETP